MKKPTLKDINAMRELMIDPFQNNLTDKIGKILEKIDPSAYDEAYAVWDDRYEKPVIKKRHEGGYVISMTIKDIKTGKKKQTTDFNSIPFQAKFDLMTSIWNMLRFNTEEIENL